MRKSEKSQMKVIVGTIVSGVRQTVLGTSVMIKFPELVLQWKNMNESV